MEDLSQLKLIFAANLLKHSDPFKAAFASTNDNGLALQISLTWPKDLAVQAEMERLLNSGETRAFLPTKEVQAKDIYGIATDMQKNVDDRLKAHRLYAEIMGHIEKPTPGTAVNILNQGVMIVKDAGSDDQWEEKAIKQQRGLIEGSTSVQ